MVDSKAIGKKIEIVLEQDRIQNPLDNQPFPFMGFYVIKPLPDFTGVSKILEIAKPQEQVSEFFLNAINNTTDCKNYGIYSGPQTNVEHSFDP